MIRIESKSKRKIRTSAEMPK